MSLYDRPVRVSSNLRLLPGTSGLARHATLDRNPPRKLDLWIGLPARSLRTNGAAADRYGALGTVLE